MLTLEFVILIQYRENAAFCLSLWSIKWVERGIGQKGFLLLELVLEQSDFVIFHPQSHDLKYFAPEGWVFNVLIL